MQITVKKSNDKYAVVMLSPGEVSELFLVNDVMLRSIREAIAMVLDTGNDGRSLSKGDLFTFVKVDAWHFLWSVVISHLKEIREGGDAELTVHHGYQLSYNDMSYFAAMIDRALSEA